MYVLVVSLDECQKKTGELGFYVLMIYENLEDLFNIFTEVATSLRNKC